MGHQKLVGEIIRLEGDTASIQVYSGPFDPLRCTCFFCLPAIQVASSYPRILPRFLPTLSLGRMSYTLESSGISLYILQQHVLLQVTLDRSEEESGSSIMHDPIDAVPVMHQFIFVQAIRPTQDRIQHTAAVMVTWDALESKCSLLATLTIMSHLWRVAASRACIRAILSSPFVDKILGNQYPPPPLLRFHVRYYFPRKSYHY